jgi:hypothetical protein
MGGNLSAVFICQKGDLEIKSALLASSLRRIFGNDIILFCGIPSILGMDSEPGTDLLDFMGSLDVRVHSFPNPVIESGDGPLQGLQFSNKIFCFPESVETGKILFLDSDLICLEKPKILYDLYSDFAGCQAFKSIDPDWHKLYSKTGIPEPALRLRSVLDGKTGFPYFNSGFYIVNKHPLPFLLEEWETLFREIRPGLSEDPLLHHSDQISLTLAVQKLKLEFEVLPLEFNYPSGSLLIRQLPFFAHYHGPEKISRDPVLYRYCRELARKNPRLLAIAEPHDYWRRMLSGDESPAALNLKYRFKKAIRKNPPGSK